MCYDIKVSLERQLKVAKHYGDKEVIAALEKQLMPLLNPIEREFYQISGFDHPNLIVLEPSGIALAEWGLIPNWTKNNNQAEQFRNNNLNARAESIQEKPSFNDAFEHGRVVLFVDGFYEHQHRGNRSYPYYIERSDKKPMALACVLDRWNDPIKGDVRKTFSIVTTKANSLMAEIHNNPKLMEPRMPLILEEANLYDWLRVDTIAEKILNTQIDPALNSHTVRPLRGIATLKNNPLAAAEFNYPELGLDLFS